MTTTNAVGVEISQLSRHPTFEDGDVPLDITRADIARWRTRIMNEVGITEAELDLNWVDSITAGMWLTEQLERRLTREQSKRIVNRHCMYTTSTHLWALARVTARVVEEAPEITEALLDRLPVQKPHGTIEEFGQGWPR